MEPMPDRYTKHAKAVANSTLSFIIGCSVTTWDPPPSSIFFSVIRLGDINSLLDDMPKQSTQTDKQQTSPNVLLALKPTITVFETI